MDLSLELEKREALMHALATEFAQNAVLTSKWLDRVDFGFGPERVKDVGKGIWNPSSYAGTLTIVPDPDSEYDDGDHGDSLYRYSYEKRPSGQDPRGGSNNKLREAMRLGLPIVMLRKIADGRFVPVMPVYLVKEDRSIDVSSWPSTRAFDSCPTLRISRRTSAGTSNESSGSAMHQPEFRSRVLGAYELKCSVCDLKKTPLLDAAHITADTATDGLPVVSNGLALCKIHHAAYDENILGISPDYVVHINGDVLTEVDGPMLKYGLQQMDRRPLWRRRTAISGLVSRRRLPCIERRTPGVDAQLSVISGRIARREVRRWCAAQPEPGRRSARASRGHRRTGSQRDRVRRRALRSPTVC